MESLMGKGRRPKFELTLKIYDLNNVPLVSGSSYIKWHLAHSIHAEHRGRTAKCPIANHRVDYSFSKTVHHIRVSVDKQNYLAECPIEFEVVQEFNVTDKITLGTVKLNLSEYVEESDALVKDHQAGPGGRRRTNSTAGVSPTSMPAPAAAESSEGPEGIVRRHLMQESKINSTLKISILMKQIDGDRNFIAPILKTAPTFGGIAGIVAHDQATAEEDAAGPTPSTGFSKPRDATEIQDLYRRTLAASWSKLSNELPADEAIEDIFAGGNGWRTHQQDNTNSTSDTEEDDDHQGQGTLRPSDFKRLQATSHHQHHRTHGHHQGHRRTGSAASDRSTMTVTARANAAAAGKTSRSGLAGDSPTETSLSRSGSLTTLGSERSRGEAGMVRDRAREVDEGEMRDDLVAWRLPSKDGVTA